MLAGDYRSAIEAASKAQPLLWTSPSFFETAEYEFYGGLARAAFCDSAPAEEQPQHLEALSAHHRQLEIWATHCPENFENRAALVGAEIARIDGRVVDAEQLYEQAIRSARATRLRPERSDWPTSWPRDSTRRAASTRSRISICGVPGTATRDGAPTARCGNWTRRIRTSRKEESEPPTRERTIGEPVEHLDLATVLKVSQAVSGEIVLEKLVETLLRTAIEHAGAERGLLHSAARE